MLTHAEIHSVFDDHYFEGMGCISGHDAQFLCALLADAKPKRCLELGVASGISTTFMLMSLERISPDCELVSLDLAKQYYANPTKPVGYVADSVIPNPNCKFSLQVQQWAADVEKIGTESKFDFVFIDANHTHPWPTIDTMLVMPFVRPGSWIVHHDIALYAMGGYEIGIGPFHVYESFPEPKKKSQAGHENIGAFQLTADYRQYESALKAAFEQPWSSPDPIEALYANRIFDITDRLYSESLAKLVRDKVADHNQKVTQHVA